jgi:AmiR/NasT family two-component response regulator
VVLEQAKGAVAETASLEMDAAFDLLRNYARRNNRRLAEVATDVVRRRLPVRDLLPTSQGT